MSNASKGNLWRFISKRIALEKIPAVENIEKTQLCALRVSVQKCFSMFYSIIGMGLRYFSPVIIER